jgi:hypothetical protein
MRCDERKGLGSLYSGMGGQDCSKTIISNGWEEDLGRFGIKNQIFEDSVHESVSVESRSIDLFWWIDRHTVHPRSINCLC